MTGRWHGGSLGDLFSPNGWSYLSPGASWSHSPAATTDLDFQSWAGPSASSRLALACGSETNNNCRSDGHGFQSPWYVHSMAFSAWSLHLTMTLPWDCIMSCRQVLPAARFADQDLSLRRKRRVRGDPTKQIPGSQSGPSAVDAAKSSGFGPR